MEGGPRSVNGGFVDGGAHRVLCSPRNMMISDDKHDEAALLARLAAALDRLAGVQEQSRRFAEFQRSVGEILGDLDDVLSNRGTI